MSPALRRRLVALEARQARRERKLRRRFVWWDVLSGEPEPVAEPGEELHVHRWMRPDEEPPPDAVRARAETAPPEAQPRQRQRWATR
jgi:hypothetical protein